jgi:hypothetical protein
MVLLAKKEIPSPRMQTISNTCHTRNPENEFFSSAPQAESYFTLNWQGMPPRALFLASWKCFASRENISLAIRLPKRTMVVPK